MGKYFSSACWMIVVVMLLPVSCVTPYNPPVNSTGTGYLVVEGYIDGAAPTVIKLSRTRAVSDTSQPLAETNAKVMVEDDHQDSYTLSDEGNGSYTISQLSLNPSYQYRVHIFTDNGEEYMSDFVPVKPSPPIDSVSWQLEDGNVQVYVNTHNPQNNTRYYRWEYAETWQINVFYYSVLQYAGGEIVPRNDQVFTCWKSDNSSDILLGSSAQLSRDVIYLQPVTNIPAHDQRISVLYSILVKQYALDTAGYNYWLLLKSNTENIGSIFDVQPSELTGNVHCVNNTSEIVVGYIGAGYTDSSRIFISNAAMPPGWNYPEDCPEITVPDIPDSIEYYFGGGMYTPISASPTGGYLGSYPNCADCTTEGGINKEPDFWP